MKKLNDVVKKRLNQHKLGESAKASHILHLTDRFLCDKLGATNTEVRAMVLKDGILTIGTASSVWSQELWAYQEELIQQIQKEFGSKSVFKVLITGLIK